MSAPVLVELSLGEPAAHRGAHRGARDVADRPGPAATLTTSDAALVAEAAEAAGVAALRLLDRRDDRAAVLDPSLGAAFLAAHRPGLGWLVDAPTTHQAPFNLARRVLSVDRATRGRLGVVLRAGEGDEVSDAVASLPGPGGPQDRWSEYAAVLGALWESFPRDALLGDQEGAVVVDDALITPIDHAGDSYRIAGPLDGPASVQGRPVLAAVAGEISWERLAGAADVVIVESDRAAGADALLGTALEHLGRPRDTVGLLGRFPVAVTETTDVAALAASLLDQAGRDRLDGFVLAPAGGRAEALAAARDLAPLLLQAPGRSGTATLRARLGLAPVAGPRQASA